MLRELLNKERFSFVGLTSRSPRCVSRVAMVAFAPVLLVSLGACSATGVVSGGEDRFDASAPAAPAIDGGVKPLADADGGTTWTAVFDDYFKAGTVTGCAGDGACHGSADKPGAMASVFVCNTDKAECRTSLLGESGLVTPGDADGSILVKLELRQSGPSGVTGFMPKRPQAVFAPSDIARIKAWIAGGAKDD